MLHPDRSRHPSWQSRSLAWNSHQLHFLRECTWEIAPVRTKRMRIQRATATVRWQECSFIETRALITPMKPRQKKSSSLLLFVESWAELCGKNLLFLLSFYRVAHEQN